MSHNLTEKSLLPLAKVWPSGLRLLTVPDQCARVRFQTSISADLPKLDSIITATGGLP